MAHTSLPLKLEARHKCMVLATDGLWEFMSDADVVDIIQRSPGAENAVRALVEEANNRWMREEQVIDDTTVALAFFRGWTPGGSGPTRA